MAGKLTVEVVTPERRMAQLEADEVIAPGADGLFGVRWGHTPYLSVLQPGALTVKESGRETKYFVSGGFLEVGDNVVRVLAESAEAVESIDVARAQQRVSDALAKLQEISPSLPAYQAQSELLQRERVRLDVASKR